MLYNADHILGLAFRCIRGGSSSFIFGFQIQILSHDQSRNNQTQSRNKDRIISNSKEEDVYQRQANAHSPLVDDRFN